MHVGNGEDSSIPKPNDLATVENERRREREKAAMQARLRKFAEEKIKQNLEKATITSSTINANDVAATDAGATLKKTN